MLFTLPLFLFYVLPLFLMIYLILPEKYKNLFLLVFSLSFYAFSAKSLTAVLLFSIVFNYSAGLLLNHRYKRIVILTGIVFNIVILGVFKYFNFFIDNANMLLQLFHLKALNPAISFFLPLGLSFYTLQNIAYLIDVYKGETEPEKNIIRFSVFVAMFPKIIVGPIERYSNLKRELTKKDVSLENFSFGARRFVIGLAKKVIIADNLDLAINAIFHLSREQLSTSVAWFGLISFTIQLYYDFSGYSDMAIGLGKMCGITIMENFNFPYISKSIQEFWQRWHISLSTWLADYIFKPVQINLRYYGIVGGIVSIFITFSISGLWHGASWNFIIWGLYHGLFLTLEFAFLGRLLKKASPIVSHVYALLVILCGWVFFRTENLSQALMFFGKMFIPTSGSPHYISMSKYLGGENILFLIVGIIFATPVSVKVGRYFLKKFTENKNIIPSKYILAIYSLILFILFTTAIMYISVQTYKPSLYGGF